ncbi:Small glutamine-rich tetratricopeptide repeat-containing protein 2 [Elasticomyces elasticus]|nr:Small glutamine-rich tetratricopeptide repeat-containing protein 2 [Elasticomyces elasticus]KAK5006801.1 hypothetical protein LTR28_006065 [Elasticomyces elasticus]
MATDSKKRLALAIIDFLNTSLTDGTLQAEDSESIEIASNCIADAFHVDPTDKAAVKDAVGGQSLLSIYGVYEKLKSKSAASTQGSSSAQEGRSSTSSAPQAGNTRKADTGYNADAEKLKSQGNAAMQKKDYPTAIDLYTQALSIQPLNPVYLSNRAAAYSAAGQHEFAKNDAELATATDPKYSKAWSRLGLARYALGDSKGSMEAYQHGIDAEGNGGSDAMKRGYETAKKRVEEEGMNADADSDDDDDVGAPAARGAGGAGGAGGMPDLAGLASMLGGGGAGGGGMPDLGSLMQNPMLRSMAQNVMQNPDMLSSIMNNPQLREMAGRFGGGGGSAGGVGAGAGGSGGGMPDIGAMMNDPAMREMYMSPNDSNYERHADLWQGR